MKYELIDGDPLSVFDSAKTGPRRFVDRQGFVKEASFTATTEHEFPDAVNAIYRVNQSREQPGKFVVSLKDGYHYGSKFF